MLNLLQKTYNCYIMLLNNVNFGKLDQKYDNIYWSTLFLKFGESDEKLIQYYENNLRCNE